MVNVVGIDPSITGTGLASTGGSTQTIGLNGVTKLRLDRRVASLRQLRAEIVAWTMGRCPTLVVIEHPAFSRAGGGAVERHWLFLDIAGTLLAQDIPVVEVGPGMRAQYATGKAGASKSAVVDAVARRFPDFETGGDENLADAVVLAAMGADHVGFPLAQLPASHRAALAKVQWPNLIGDEK